MQVGIDIQEVEPVKRFIGTNKMQRVFSESELQYIKERSSSPRTITGLFCAKEAFFKAIGTGIQVNNLTKVEIKHNDQGAPYYQIDGKILRERGLDTKTISLSISHTHTIATAICIIS